MNESLRHKLDLAKKNLKENQLLVNKLKRNKPKNLDTIVHQAHDEVFEKIG